MRFAATLKTKVIVATVVIAVTTVLGSAIVVSWLSQAHDGAVRTAAAADRLAGDVLDLELGLDAMRYDALEVQQWLTDVSATRALEGHDEGFARAEAAAASFDDNRAKTVALAERLGWSDVADAIGATAASFPAYYAAGQTMAKAYVEGGPAAGNASMSGFDQAAERLAAAIGTVMKQVGDHVEEERRLLAADIADYRSVAMLTLFGPAGSAVLVVGAFAAGSFLLIRFVFSPLGRLADALRVISSGDFSVAIEGIERKDEIGEISRVVAMLRDGSAERAHMALEREREQAARTERVHRREGLVNDFRAGAGDLTRQVTQTMAGMRETAARLREVASGVAGQAGDASEASAGASASVETVAAAAEELSASIGEISRRVGETTDIVALAAGRTRETDAKITGLADAVTRIGDVVGLISSIAAQTNLLALNATIEAARAGEMGRGFAVVASEVKTLATQTAKATDEIASQIAGIQSSTAEAVAAIREIAETMETVNHATSAIAAAVEEQGSATAEISRSVQDASRGTSRVSANVHEVFTAIGEVDTAAGDVGAAVELVSRNAGELTTRIDRFIRDFAA